MIYGKRRKIQSTKTQAGNAGAVTHAAVKAILRRASQFPVLVKQNSSNNVTQIFCKPQLEILQGQINETGRSSWRSVPWYDWGNDSAPECIFESFESVRRSPRVRRKSMWALKLHFLPILSAHTPQRTDQFQLLKETGERSTTLNGPTFVSRVCWFGEHGWAAASNWAICLFTAQPHGREGKVEFGQ